MKLVHVIRLAAMCGALASPALAQEQKAEKPKEKLVCKTERVTGSLTKVNRICATQADWDRLAAETNREVGKLSRAQARFFPKPPDMPQQ